MIITKIDTNIHVTKVGISVWSSQDNSHKDVRFSRENPVKNVQ